MICAINCTCLLCRELQSCKPKNMKCNSKKGETKAGDNFILRKAEGFRSSNALGFIRGAARLSVRHWQNKETCLPQHGTQPPRVNKSTSCEHLFPLKNTDNSPSRIFRAPSCEQLCKSRLTDQKPLFKVLTETVNIANKFHGSDVYVCREQASSKTPGKFRKKDDRDGVKNTYEKYVPLPPPAPTFEGAHNGRGCVESKQKYVNGDDAGECKSHIYQEVRKKLDKNKIGKPSSMRISESNKKQTTDLAACFQELSRKNVNETRKSHNVTISEGLRRSEPPAPERPAPDKINHKVVIYFGDSIARNRHTSEKLAQKNEPKKKEDIYAKRLLEETGNLGINKEQKISGTAELISKMSTENEPIYSEIPDSDRTKSVSTEQNESTVGNTPLDKKEIANVIYQDSTKSVVATCADDGVINVQFKDNFECARKLVDIINGKNEEANEATFLETDSVDSLDWSFVQDWRKRPPSGSRGDVSYTSGSPSHIQNSINFKHASPTSKPAHTTSLHLLTQSPQNGGTSPASGGNAASRVHTPANIVQQHKIPKEFCLASKGLSIDKHDDLLPHSHSNGQRQKSEDIGRQTHSHHIMMAHNNRAVPQSPSYALDLTSVNLVTSMASKSAHLSQQHSMIPERDTGPSKASALPAKIGSQIGTPIKSVISPSKITVQSTPVKCQNPMISYGLDRNSSNKDCNPSKEWRIISGNEGSTEMEKPSLQIKQHHHDTKNEIPRIVRECNSSSDENRSSGHASMSDSGGGCGGGGSGGAGGVGGRTSPPSPSATPSASDKLCAGVTQRSTRSRPGSHHSRTRHRATPAKVLQSPWPGGGGLDDIRTAIRQLTLRSRASTTSTATSTCTTTSCSEGGGGTGGTGGTCASGGSPTRRRRQALARHPSLDTVCTNVTSADEFVWVDSHNRLVELQQLPWNASDLQRALHQGRCKDHMSRVSTETVPRLGYLLQRALVRVAREAHRLSQSFGICSKHEIAGALRIVLCPSLADSCVKACLRAGTMFAVSGDTGLRQSKSQRAALQLSVGRFHRWMVDVRLGRFIHEYAAIYLCAGMETLLEELLLQCLPSEVSTFLTPSILEHAIAASGDLWGLLQPYAHLNAGRVASGALSMPRWASLSSIGSGGSSNNSTTNSTNEHNSSGHTSSQQVSSPGGNQSLGNHSAGSGVISRASNSGGSVGSMTDSCLLTTCVGTVAELRELLTRVPHSPPLTTAAVNALFYFMRCSQLEHSTSNTTVTTSGNATTMSAVQELWYERAYTVLPPLVEWTRVASAHAEHRAAHAADSDDVLQAARLLLPGVDCPPRSISMDDPLQPRKATNPGSSASADDGIRATMALAQRLLTSGRPELLSVARGLLPSNTGIDALDFNGLTALMRAASAGDEQATTMLLEAGADPNIETPGCASVAGSAALLGVRSPMASVVPQHQNASINQPHPPGGSTSGWTALVYAAGVGGSNAKTVSALLLRAGAKVEGAAGGSDEKCTLTPLQVACGSGNLELVQLLLSHGAHPFLSTLLKDSLCYSGSAQRGCYSAISVCCTHGQRGCLRALLAHPTAPQGDVLSLEEMLAEGAAPLSSQSPQSNSSGSNSSQNTNKFTKSQLRALQEAMYHAAETNHLDITLELRGLGIGWSLHAWMLSLAAAADARADCVIDQLLQDFLQVCPPDDSHYGRAFVHDCLPLLFNIFRYSKKEGTTLLLADIFCTCYGWEPIKPIREPAPMQSAGSRIDPKFVNNPELSDVTFRVEGRLFYGHKIVLVTSSPRLRAMLAPPRPTSHGQSNANQVLAGNQGTSNATGSNPNLVNGPTSQSPIVQINDIRYHIFQQVMQFLYSGGCTGLDVPPGDILELLAATSFFQLLPLQRHCEARAALSLDMHNVVSMYIHAKVYNATQLLEYCQGFLLQNMVALLTYDDSVKRLLFGKRLPGHDVLSGLLMTLQNRIKSKKTNNKNRS